jgi:hypothetical protein
LEDETYAQAGDELKANKVGESEMKSPKPKGMMAIPAQIGARYRPGELVEDSKSNEEGVSTPVLRIINPHTMPEQHWVTAIGRISSSD